MIVVEITIWVSRSDFAPRLPGVRRSGKKCLNLGQKPAPNTLPTHRPINPWMGSGFSSLSLASPTLRSPANPQRPEYRVCLLGSHNVVGRWTLGAIRIAGNIVGFCGTPGAPPVGRINWMKLTVMRNINKIIEIKRNQYDEIIDVLHESFELLRKNIIWREKIRRLTQRL